MTHTVHELDDVGECISCGKYFDRGNMLASLKSDQTPHSTNQNKRQPKDLTKKQKPIARRDELNKPEISTGADPQWVVEQAVYLKARSKNSPWSLNEEVKKVIEAFELAQEQLKKGKK